MEGGGVIQRKGFGSARDPEVILTLWVRSKKVVRRGGEPFTPCHTPKLRDVTGEDPGRHRRDLERSTVEDRRTTTGGRIVETLVCLLRGVIGATVRCLTRRGRCTRTEENHSFRRGEEVPSSVTRTSSWGSGSTTLVGRGVEQRRSRGVTDEARSA